MFDEHRVGAEVRKMSKATETGRNPKLAILILAAGKGKRMKSDIPKVLHEICGFALVGYVLEAVEPLRGQVRVIVGNGASAVERAVGSECLCVLQAEQRGTGHAVMVGLEGLDPGVDEVLVLAGDAPLVTAATLESLVEARREAGAAASMMTATIEDPRGCGRIVRREGGAVEAIVEEADATAEQRGICEVNSCTYVFEREALERGLEALTTNNAQGEYYLTDVVKGFASVGAPVVTVAGTAEEVLGVNDREQLALACSIMRRRISSRLMAEGVSIVDPSNTYIDHGVSVASGTVVMPMVFITGESSIGENCTIGPCTSINDTSVADDCSIQFSTVDGCEIMSGANVGPFSRLRPGCRLGPESKAGSFVEMKKTNVGRGSKVPHLSYMGDTTIGEGANVGAGSITCNYDGVNKFPTTIGDGAFIGSDTMLVAPVNIGKDSVTGAGSVITSDVPDGSLGIERTEQKIIPDYGKRRKKGNKDKGK